MLLNGKEPRNTAVAQIESLRKGCVVIIMKKSWKWVIIAAISAVLFAGIFFLYGALKENYAPDPFSNKPKSAQTSDSNESADYTAPDFTVLDENGNAVKLSDFFGKPIVLNFWASWCYYCKEEMPDFNAAYHDNPDVQFIMVNVTDGNQETMSSAKKFIEDSEYDFPVFYDTELDASAKYGASGLPMTVFVSKDGELVTYAKGMLSAENLKKGIDMIKD